MLNNLPAERGVLACLIQNPNTLFDVDNIITSADFSNNSNKEVYTVIKHIIIKDGAENIDKMMVVAAANQLGLENFSEVTRNHKLIDAFLDLNVNKESIRSFALKVKEAAIRRGLAKQLKKAQNIVETSKETSITELASEAESTIFNYLNVINMGDEMEQLGDGFFDWANDCADNPQEFVGLQTQYPRWDRAIGGGLRRATVTTVAARAKTGKSAFLLNVAAHMATVKKIPVLYLDSEMTREYQRIRYGSLLSDVPSDFLENGSWRSNPQYVKGVTETKKVMKDNPNFYHVSIAERSMDYIVSTIRRFLAKIVGYDEAGRIRDCLVVYDYLKFSEIDQSKDNGKEYQLLGFYLNRIHDIANVYKIPVLMALQTNRDGITREDESVVAGSDRITWNCSSLSLLKEKTTEEILADGSLNGNIKLKCVLSRYGNGHDDDDYLNLQKDKNSWRFVQKKNKQDMNENLKSIIDKQKVERSKDA